MALLCVACVGGGDDVSELPPEIVEYLASEPTFDTEIRWNPSTETVSVDEFDLRLPNFRKSDIEFLMSIYPVLSSIEFRFSVDGEPIGVAAIGVLRQTFLATDGAEQILDIPWELEGLTEPRERITSDTTSQGRRCILEYRLGLTIDQQAEQGAAVLLISGPTTPPLVIFLGQVGGDLGQGVIDAIMAQVC